MTDSDAKCCLVLPMKPGLMVLAIFMCIGSFYCIWGGIALLGASLPMAIGHFVICAPFLLVFYYCIMWLKEDKAETRKLFTFACLICIIVYLIFSALAIVDFLAVTKNFGFFLQQVIFCGLNFLLQFYWWSEAKRYQVICGDA